jgi:hypothetical protein
MKDFNSNEHVEEWLAANGGLNELRRALDVGRFAGQNKTLAEAWLKAYDRKQLEVQEFAERSLSERSVQAAEASARSASESATWAKWAVVIAVVALLVSALQYLNLRP